MPPDAMALLGLCATRLRKFEVVYETDEDAVAVVACWKVHRARWRVRSVRLDGDWPKALKGACQLALGASGKGEAA